MLNAAVVRRHICVKGADGYGNEGEDKSVPDPLFTSFTIGIVSQKRCLFTRQRLLLFRNINLLDASQQHLQYFSW